ncbi:hypothetical protein GGI43DRAFT_432270 [Trichoderma evansii]
MGVLLNCALVKFGSDTGRQNREDSTSASALQGVKKPVKDFASLIHTARSSKSTDPRDKIYALLGLINDQVVHSVIPDYNKPVEDLYVEVTAHIIHLYNHLDILSDIGYQTREEIEATNAFKISTLAVEEMEIRVEAAAKALAEAEKQAEPVIKALCGGEVHYTDDEAAQHPLLQSVELARREHFALMNDLHSSRSSLKARMKDVLYSQSRFIHQDQQSLPSWVPELDKHPCLASLSTFRTESRTSIFQQPVARLCRSRDLSRFPALEIKILELDTVI